MRRFFIEAKQNIRLTGGLNERREFNRLLRAAKKNIPNAYLPDTLTKADRAILQRAILTSRAAYDENKYVDRPPVASFRSKPSQHVERAKKKYGLESMNDLKTLSHRTGCSIDSLKKIVQKGQGAYYSSGSRPNQSAKAWGLARLASAVTGGKAKKYDINLLKQGGCDASVLSAGANYPWLTYEEAKEFLPEAEKEKVSVVARGSGGFMDVYKTAKTPQSMMQKVWVGANNRTEPWGVRRENFIKRHMAQYTKKPTKRRRLALLMWAFDPDVSNTTQRT